MADSVDPRVVDPLVVGRVIGDVVDMFAPRVGMSVYYGAKHVTNGCTVKPSAAAAPPSVHIPGRSPEEHYTLLIYLLEHDSYPLKNHKMCRCLNYLSTRSQIRPDLLTNHLYVRIYIYIYIWNMCMHLYIAGKEIVPYMGPRPPVGIHRYVMVLFQQKEPLTDVEPPASRAHFSTRSFSGHHDLGLPVATVYFNAQKEPRVKKRS
ncbi:hypothetical protein Sjap_024858 [Stephania japonica]|uniref:Uncharacterized protein n=1 Tax=Stephania japonica TaxID=461633 RepID=A0AAP0HPD4_9MAGN